MAHGLKSLPALAVLLTLGAAVAWAQDPPAAPGQPAAAAPSEPPAAAAGAPAQPSPPAGAAVDEEPPPGPAEVSQEDLLKANGDVPDIVVGNADAKVTIVEYASLSCSHCANFHNKVLPDLKSKYLDTGKARLIIREFPTSESALVAAMLTRCIAPDKAYPLLSELFHKQEEWAFGNEVKTKMKEIALAGGLTEETFESCVKDQALFDKLVKNFSGAGDKFGINSTPTFFINGKRLSDAATLPAFDKALSEVQ